MVKYFITIFFFLFFVRDANAALLSFKVQDIKAGAPVLVDVLLDTEDEIINSAEIKLSFPDSLKFKGHDISKSSILVWLNKPQLDKNGTIIFSGIIPGGIERVYDPENIDQKAITLARLVFEPKSDFVEGEFKILEALVLKNDGKGTEIPVSNSSELISFKSNNNFITEDLNPPKPFTIEIIDSSLFAKTPRLAIFNTLNEGSGIERYEARIGLAKYKTITSPHPLPYKLWTYKFSVRAIDYAGNTREASIVIPGNKPLLIGTIFVVLFTTYLFYNYQRRKKHEV